MFKRMLVTTDGSKIATYALKQAIAFAKNQKAVLHIVHIVDDSTHIAMGEGVNIESYEESAVTIGETILAHAVKMAQDEKVKAESKLLILNQLSGGITDNILAEAKHFHADLIVIGTHAHTGIKRWVAGSIAEELSKKCAIPLLLIREG